MSDEVCLVILGAGASHDCFAEDVIPGTTVFKNELLGTRDYDEVRMPLTSDLARATPFNNSILMRYPAAAPVVDELRRRLGPHGATSLAPTDTLESVLAEYLHNAETDPAMRQHLVGVRFYLRDMLWACSHYMGTENLTGGITNYVTLLNRLQFWAFANNKRVCIVSFNYDLLLDYAAHRVWGFKEGDLGQFCNLFDTQRMMLQKPHGSVAWEWRVAEGPKTADDARARLVIERANDIDLDETYPMQLAVDPWSRFPQRDGLGVPALALPITTKTSLVWPPEHALAFTDLAGRVDRVLTIGWRGMEGHFLPLLKPLIRPGAPRLVVTGGTRGTAEAEDLQKRLRGLSGRGSWEAVHDAGFASLLRSPLLEKLLNEPITLR